MVIKKMEVPSRIAFENLLTLVFGTFRSNLTKFEALLLDFAKKD